MPVDLVCDDCILQLEREAFDVSAGYWFWSCADVTIVRPPSYFQQFQHNANLVTKLNDRSIGKRVQRRRVYGCCTQLER